MEWFDNENRNMLRQAAAKFAKSEITEKLIDLEAPPSKVFPMEMVKAGAEAGYLSLSGSTGLSEMELNAIDRIIVIYELARAAAGAAVIFAVHDAAMSAVITGMHKDEVVSWTSEIVDSLTGNQPALLGLALPESITDEPYNVNEDICSDYICLLGPEVAEYILTIKPDSGSAVISAIDSNNLKNMSRTSYPGSGLDEFNFCRLSTAGTNLRGIDILSTSENPQAINKVMGLLKLNLASILCGNAEAAFDQALVYAGERMQTGRLIIQHQQVRQMLSSIKVSLEAGKSFLYRAGANAESLILENNFSLFTNTFRFCGTVAEEVCLGAMQILGGYGYMRDYGIEKRLRDTKTLQNLPGSNFTDALDFSK